MLERFTWFKQSAFRWEGDDLTVYIDPVGVTGDVPADVIFITHPHWDHFDREELERIRKHGTKIVAPVEVAGKLSGDVTAVGPGDTLEVAGIKIQVVPAYNIHRDRLDAHPKANHWVGYVLELGGSTYYHAGDTDDLPELGDVRADVAFLPIDGRFTMTAQEAGGLAKAIEPGVAVPMHYGFVVGTPKDAERFRKASAPVRVEVLTPEHPFEKR
jgi:L-ascorbate metabolism protein UlaG (beta-lactamase superfamily)